jgi:hypothetical protein
MYWRSVGKSVVRCEMVYLIVRGLKSTQIKARINAIEKNVGSISVVMHPKKIAVNNISFRFMICVAQFVKYSFILCMPM